MPWCHAQVAQAATIDGKFSSEAAVVHAPPLLMVPKPDGDVTLRGVSPAFLLGLVETKVLDASWTIQETVDKFVRPQTSAHK